MRRVQQLCHVSCHPPEDDILNQKSLAPPFSKILDLLVKGSIFLVPQFWIKFVTKCVAFRSAIMVCGLYWPSPVLPCFAYTSTTTFVIYLYIYINSVALEKGKLDKILNLN